MLGYDVDFGHMEAVSLISAPKYPEKQASFCALYLVFLVAFILILHYWINFEYIQLESEYAVFLSSLETYPVFFFVLKSFLYLKKISLFQNRLVTWWVQTTHKFLNEQVYGHRAILSFELVNVKRPRDFFEKKFYVRNSASKGWIFF